MRNKVLLECPAGVIILFVFHNSEVHSKRNYFLEDHHFDKCLKINSMAMFILRGVLDRTTVIPPPFHLKR